MARTIATFFGNYLPIGIFLIVFIGFKIMAKSRFVKGLEMDLTLGLDEIERNAAEAKEGEEHSKAAKSPSRLRDTFKRILA